MDCMFEIFVISLLRRLMIFLKKVLRPMFDTELLQHSKIELFHVVHYNSKWSTEFHMDCMFDFFVISLLRRLMIILLIF